MTIAIDQIITRDEVSSSNTWNIEVLYDNLSEWKKAFDEIKESKREPYWPSLKSECYDVTDPDSVLGLLEKLFSIDRTLDKLYIYAHLLHDQDLTNSVNTEVFQEISVLHNNFTKETSWIKPALTALSKETITHLKNSDQLKTYSFFLEKIFRTALHTGTENEEKILASSQIPLSALESAFSNLNDSEIPFGIVKNSKNEELPMSHGFATLYMQSPDRELRKNCYLSMLSRYQNYKDTFAQLLYGQISAHFFKAQARKFPSCLAASLFANNIPESVYHNLIDVCQNHVHLFDRYMNLKKRYLKIDEMKPYDIYAPLVLTEDAATLTYDEAVDIIVKSLSILGPKYTEILKKGITTDRWVDKYENKNKRSGAYSSGSYDTLPYILLNFKGSVYDGSILAHEAGHSMHSYLSRHNQSCHDAGYPLFLAEIASTFNEIFYSKYLTEHSTDIKQKISYISRQLDTIFSTLFRQTMFADFELKIHNAVEKNETLTAMTLSSIYEQTLKKYLGSVIVTNPESTMEWARIPHFYYNFYVYQYATGISAALCFSQKIINKEPGAVDRYLTFLKSGGSAFSIDILKKAGVDMTQPDALNETMRFIETQIQLLETLIEN